MPAKSVSKSASKSAPKSSKKSASPPKVEEVKVEPPVNPLTENVVVEDASAVPVSPIFESMTSFGANLQALYSQMNAVKAEFRALEKKIQKEVKQAQKITAKKAKRKGTRAPSGFVKPTKISKELAVFLQKPEGSEMARTDVTREINAYIRSNSLQDKDNGRKINPDKKLTALLKIEKGDELTYFNLQKYMSHHFEKSVKAPVASS